MGNPAFAVGLVSVLTWAALSDISSRRIPNAASLVTAGLWAAYLLLAKLAPLPGFAAGAGTLLLGFSAWRFGLLGGGDVKLLSALALWAGPDFLVEFLLLTAAFGGGLALAWLLMARYGPLLAVLGIPPSLVMVQTKPSSLPYGVAIAAAGWWLVYKLLLA